MTSLTTDPRTLLEDFIDNIDNIPHEILFLFEDIQQKDTLVQDAYASIKKNEEELRDAIRDSKTDQDYAARSPKKGSKAKSLKEAASTAMPIFNDDQQLALYEGIHAEFGNAKTVMEDKITLSKKAVELIDRQIRKLSADIDRIDVLEGRIPAARTPSQILLKLSAETTQPKVTSSLLKVPEKAAGGHKRRISQQDARLQFTLKRPSPKREPGDGSTEDETVYCFCRQVSYGEMIACESDECQNEWFHLNCVGLTGPPNGVWYCPDCRERLGRTDKKRMKH